MYITVYSVYYVDIKPCFLCLTGNQCSPMLISSPAPGTSGIKCDSECFGEYTQEIFENLKCKEVSSTTCI